MKIESEHRWAQKIVKKWAAENLMADVPAVNFVEEDEPPEGLSVAYYGDNVITLRKKSWRSMDTFGKIWVLGHEFIHWLQDKRNPEILNRTCEQEANKLGKELARKQIARWGDRPKLPLQLELPLE